MTEKRKNKHKFLKVALAFMLTGIIVSYFSTDIVQSQVLATNQSQDKTVEKPPVFKGGQEAMMKYFAENINYPEEAKKKGVSGVVYISMVIDKKGKVVDPKIKKGIGAGCDEEALRAVTKMPDWIPGEKNGEKISTEMVLPVKFKLDDKKKK